MYSQPPWDCRSPLGCVLGYRYPGGLACYKYFKVLTVVVQLVYIFSVPKCVERIIQE